MSIEGLPLILFKVVPPITGDGLADNYYNFPTFSNDNISSLIQQIGYNNGAKLLILLHQTPIVIGSGNAKSLHRSDDSTAYQNTTGNVVHVIVTPIITNDGPLNSYKIYSAPNNDSLTGATEVFDLADFTINWDISASFDRWTSALVPIQDNHFIVIENTGTGGALFRIETNDTQGPFSLVVEPPV